MLITVREVSSSLCSISSLSLHSNYKQCFNNKPSNYFQKNSKNSICRATLTVQRKPDPSWNLKQSCESSEFDPLGINSDGLLDTKPAWKDAWASISQALESASNTRKEKASSARGVAAAIEDTSIDFGDFFKGPLPEKFLKLLGYLAVSRLGIYIPLGGVNREAFVGNLDQNSLLSTLDSFSGGGIGRLGICSLGIVPFINAQIVFQLLTQIYPKLQELQKREGEAGRKKILQYTRYASVGFAIVQAIGQVLFLRPYVNDFSTQWALTSVILLTLGSVFTTYIGERITDLKLGNGTSLLIFTNIISYLPASFGRTVAQGFQDGNYVGLIATIVSFFLLVLSIVYVQEAERKIPLNYASRFTSRTGGLEKSAYLPFKVNSSGVMPIIFSTSSLALPGTLARFTGLGVLKNAAAALNPGEGLRRDPFDCHPTKAKPEATQPSLPQWLQNAKLDSQDAIATDDTQGNDQGMLSKQKTRELQKKWVDTCLNLHPDFHRNICSERTAPAATLSMTSLKNPSLLAHQSCHPKLQTSKPLGESLQLNINQVTSRPAGSPPVSPVRTDLILGRKGTESTPKKTTEDYVKDSVGYISSEPKTKLLDKFESALDSDSYKKLLKGLMAKAWWQAEAASAVASAITHCRLGNGKRRGAGSRGDIWLLFTGPDRVAKKKMASVLAEQICGTNPVLNCLSSRRDYEDSDVNFRGKTAIDRIAEAVHRNPFSVIMLEDIDEADMMVRGSIKQAMDRGQLTDTHGRDISLGNAIFILTGDWSITNPKDGHFVDEKKFASVTSGNCQLELIVKEKSAKRQANWLSDEDRPTKPRIEVGSGLSLDLNLAADNEDETDTSFNSSVLTIDHEDVLCLENTHFSITSVPQELASNVDDSIPFKPVDLTFVLHEIKKTISVKFAMVVDDNMRIKVEDDVIEKILGGVLHDRISLQEWIEKVLVPGFEQLKMHLPSVGGGSKVVWLMIDSESGGRDNGDWFPSRITVKG